jgi:hypothetical protein
LCISIFCEDYVYEINLAARGEHHKSHFNGEKHRPQVVSSIIKAGLHGNP